MTSTTIVHHGPPPDDYGLDAVAKHNAATSIEQFPPNDEEAKGLGIYVSNVAVYRPRTYTDLM
jgi:hypothetical protein